MKNFKQKGFTLIEAIIVLSVIGIVANVTAMLLFQAFQSTHFAYTYSETQSEARIAFDRMKKEIHRVCISSDIIISDSGHQLQFQMINPQNQEETVTYARTAGDVLMRSASAPLADHVTQLDFSAFDQDGNVIDMSQEVGVSGIYYLKIFMIVDESNHPVPFTAVVARGCHEPS